MSHGKLSKVFAVSATELVCRLKEEVFGRLGAEAGTVGKRQHWPLVLGSGGE